MTEFGGLIWNSHPTHNHIQQLEGFQNKFPNLIKYFFKLHS